MTMGISGFLPPCTNLRWPVQSRSLLRNYSRVKRASQCSHHHRFLRTMRLTTTSPSTPTQTPATTPTTTDLSRFAQRVQSLENEGAYAVMNTARLLETQTGQRIIHLEIGQPCYDTPQHITTTAINALTSHYTKYSEPAGISSLRQAIAKFAGAKRGFSQDEIKEEHIVVGPGAKCGLLWSLMALVEVDDEVIIPNPGFPSYQAMVEICGGVVKQCNVGRYGAGYDIKMLEDLLEKGKGKVKVVILNSPGNPTGGVCLWKDLKEIGRLVKKYGCWVIADEIYSELVYDDIVGDDGDTEGFKSILQVDEMMERTVVVDGFSKAFCMTGWRLGYAIMPKLLAERVELLAVHTVGCTATFTQLAGVAALEGDQRELRKMVEEYKRRRDLCVEGIDAIEGAYCNVPKGAFYLWVDISGFGMSSRDIAHRLLHEGLVAVLPGTDFGGNGEGFIRISYVSEEDDLREGMRRVKKVLDGVRLHEPS